MSELVVTITPGWTDELAGMLGELRVIFETCPDAAKEFSRLRLKSSDIFQAHREAIPAGRAAQVLLLLEPTDRFRELMATLRALKVGGEVVERNNHGNPLSSGFDGCDDHDSTAERDSRPNSRDPA